MAVTSSRWGAPLPTVTKTLPRLSVLGVKLLSCSRMRALSSCSYPETAGIPASCPKSIGAGPAGDCASAKGTEIAASKIPRTTGTSRYFIAHLREKSVSILPAKRLDQSFLLFFRVDGERVERCDVSPDRGRGQHGEGFRREPAIARPLAQHEHRRADAKQQNLRAERHQHRHAGLPLAVDLAKC